ncbi:MAG TPA: hypothetical protein VFD91_06590, partial [Mariniphaga sp.]|nr:hypothetical protein [Mariniphaga sp.]
MKTLLGTTSKPEEVIIDQHFNWTTITEYRDEIKIFYQNREFKPVWFNKNSLNPLGEELITELKESWKEGIPEPTGFLTNIENALIQLSNSSSTDNPKAQIITEADVSLTQLYFDFASKIYSGILDPAELEVIWEILPDEIDLVEHLEVALTKGDISGSFNQLRPKHEQYDLLLEAFSNLLQLKNSGGWPLPGNMPVLKENESHNNIALVKKHLQATGDHNETD